jgi:hypothetical protein
MTADQPQSHGIWSTLEMHCVSADLAYEADYLAIHKRSGAVWAPLSKRAYDLLGQVFNASYEDAHPELAAGASWPIKLDSNDFEGSMRKLGMNALADGAKREHIAGADCWCHPEIDYTDPVTGVSVYVHKRPQ